jgi:hypothetical protein
MDAGLLGLYRISQKEQSKESGVEINLNDSGVSFKGTEKNVQFFLQNAYDRLLKDYYNTSSQNQIEKNEGFYYDTVKDQFIRFPKVKPMGIAGLIFNKAPRPTKNEIKYDKSQGQKGILPEENQHLQERLNCFLSENKLKIGSASLLVDGPNAIQPKVDIRIKSSKIKGSCFLCGEPASSLNEIGGTVFPMITGSSGVRSFNSEGGNPENVCWKCDFIAKFVPVTGFYNVNKDTTHIYFPYSASLEKMSDVCRSLDSTKIEDPHFMRNFDNRFGGYFQKPYEQFFTFLYSLYRIVMTKRISPSADEDDYELDYEALFDVNLNRAPLDFFVVYTESLGDAQMGKMIWPFHESVYLFRLLDHLEKNKIDLKKVMTLLVDYDQPKNESKTILRNRVCENILKKQSIVALIEQHAFRINKSKTQNIRPLNDFVILYEKTIREGDTVMDQKIIDVAVSVGKTIGMSIAPSGKKGKGDLFRLRKTRKPEDFLNEINRIQMKYGTKVSADLYNQGQKMEENFSEFKQFCMIAALNTYNAGNPAPVETIGKTKVEASS